MWHDTHVHHDEQTAPLAPIPFSRPAQTPNESAYLAQALASGVLQGDGPMTAACTDLLRTITGCKNPLLTTSCTHALELGSMLLDLKPGDEVVLPSFTFSSTATAITTRGATPVFCDIEPERLGLDPNLLEACITDKTKAIYVVHYAGIAADMPAIMQIAEAYGLPVLEDAAHALGASDFGQKLGTIGAIGALSFHATKNISCGEGGAILINDPTLKERAEIIREKGTNRSQFLRGQVDKYTWRDNGSSYLPSELQAAVLRSQLESFESIQAERMTIWRTYRTALGGWAYENQVRVVEPPSGSSHPAHMFAIILPDSTNQKRFIAALKDNSIGAAFHYVPLDTSPAGRLYGRTPNPCTVTADTFSRLVRVPLYTGITPRDLDRILEHTLAFRCEAS